MSVPPARIPVFLLSGFLGAGKSTLLNELLEDNEFADSAVIINEFGDVPVDHLLVREGGTAINQVATGCLCCSGSTDLRTTLFDLHCAASAGLCPPFSRVIVEMSGLGDPAPLVNSLTIGHAGSVTLRDRTIEDVFHLAGFVTLYDIITGPVSIDWHFEVLKQVAFADRIVLTKTDLAKEPATKADIAALPAELAHVNASAPVIDRHETTLAALFVPRAYSAVERGEDVAGWLALEAVISAERANGPAPHATGSTGRHGAGIRSFSIIRDDPIAQARVQRFLAVLQETAGRGLLRVKGIVAVAEDPDRPHIIHAVQHLASEPVVLESWPDNDRRTRLVFITNDIDPGPVRDLFQAVIEGEPASSLPLLARFSQHLLTNPFTSLRQRFVRPARRQS